MKAKNFPFASPLLASGWDTTELADWVELTAIAGREFRRGSLQTVLNRVEADFGDPAERAQEAWVEVVRRVGLYRSGSAIRLAGDTVKLLPNHKNLLWHFFLCTLSLGADVDVVARRLFEWGVADVVRGLTGRTSIRMGSPRASELPAQLDAAVAVYTQRAQEEKSNRPFVVTDKDFGLDVASWREFQDRRGAYLPFIGNCATGKDWYEDNKAFELQLDMWQPHVHWSVTPVRFFALPFVVPPQHWIRAANAGGLVLDRPRLLELALNAPLTLPRRHSIHDYCVRMAAAAAA